MEKILFVCHGNICRSPMAEFVMKHLVEEAELSSSYEISSAAVSREEIGNDMYPPAKATLRTHNIPFTKHTARQITAADYDYYDKIILMDNSNRRLLARIIQSDPAQKISLLMEAIGSSRDVADPWYTGDFEATYSDVYAAYQTLLQQKEDASY